MRLWPHPGKAPPTIPVSAERQNQDLFLEMNLRNREFAFPETTCPRTEFLLPIGESLLVRLRRGPRPDRRLSRLVSHLVSRRRHGGLDLHLYLKALNYNILLIQCPCRTRRTLHHLDHPLNPSPWPCDLPSRQAIQYKLLSLRILLGV